MCELLDSNLHRWFDPTSFRNFISWIFLSTFLKTYFKWMTFQRLYHLYFKASVMISEDCAQYMIVECKYTPPLPSPIPWLDWPLGYHCWLATSSLHPFLFSVLLKLSYRVFLVHSVMLSCHLFLCLPLLLLLLQLWIYQLVEMKKETTRSSWQGCFVMAHSSGGVLVDGFVHLLMSDQSRNMPVEINV